MRCSISRTKLAEKAFGCEAFPVQLLILAEFVTFEQRDHTRKRRKRADLNAKARKRWINWLRCTDRGLGFWRQGVGLVIGAGDSQSRKTEDGKNRHCAISRLSLFDYIGVLSRQCCFILNFGLYVVIPQLVG